MLNSTEIKKAMGQEFKANDFVKGDINRTYFNVPNLNSKVKIYFDNNKHELVVENSGRDGQLDAPAVQKAISLGAKVIKK